MKNILVLILLILMLSCKSNNSNLINNSDDIKSENEILDIDTSSFKHFVLSTDKQEELPKHLIDSFIGSNWRVESDLYREFYGDNRTQHYFINNNTVLTFNMSTGGVCTNIILATFNDKGKMIANLAIAQYCDAELSSASYSYNDYEIIADTLIKTYKHTTQAINYKYTLPDTIDGLLDVKTKEIIEYRNYILKPNGTFKEVETSKTLR